MRTRVAVLGAVLLALAAGLYAEDDKKDEGWIELFNGKDTKGWKLRAEKISVTKFVDSEGKEIKDAKAGKVDQKVVIQDKQGKVLEGAKLSDKDKKTIVDSEGNPIKDAKMVKTG